MTKIELTIGVNEKSESITVDLNETPHLLIAGSTGSGKSNFIHSIITSLIKNNGPKDIKMIMVDTKMIELGLYEGIPHLVEPIVTKACEFACTVYRLREEIDRRLELFKNKKVRNLEEYNNKVEISIPSIIVVIDEMADLFDTDDTLAKRLASILNVSRATGIHLILATQRPSSDLIPGSIKANVPGRLAFKTASSVDSHIIIGRAGAEKLIDKGSALYRSSDNNEIIQVGTALIPLSEIENSIKAAIELSVKSISDRVDELIPAKLDSMVIDEKGVFDITEADYRMCIWHIIHRVKFHTVSRREFIYLLCSSVRADMAIKALIASGFLIEANTMNTYSWNVELGWKILRTNTYRG